jgi:FkbM family methyltransferase
MLLRWMAGLLPQPFVARLNDIQTRHTRTGSLLRTLGERVATGEGTIRRGPAAGLRIDASGRMPGYVLGTADYEEQLWLAEHLKPGETFYDIGANIGFFTLLAARLVGPKGAVVAFEPLPANVDQLRKTIALNDLSNVTVVASAMSSTESVGQFAPGRDARDAGRLVAQPADGTIEVRVTTVDAAAEQRSLRPPSVIKVDVEGEEVETLRGALETIARHRPVLLVEVHWLGRLFLDFVEEALAPLGYRASTLGGEQLPADPDRFHAVLTAS